MNLRSWAIGATLIAAAVAAPVLAPSQSLADGRAPTDLEAMVPLQFGEWRASEDLVPVAPDPRVAAKVENAYAQVVARSYVDARNRRVMLSIAYGGDQRNDRMQAHRPEYCYAAQGFDVRPVRNDRLTAGEGTIPVRRLLAQRGPRHEPITYWITIGDQTALPGLQRKLLQLRYGLTGTIPDGMLVRVSSLDAEAEAGYAHQDDFIRALLASLDAEARARIAGAAR